VASGDNGEPLDVVCERILETVTDRALRDDIALLAIRLSSAQQPISPEAPAAAGSRQVV